MVGADHLVAVGHVGLRPEEQRAVVLLIALEDFSYREAAEVLAVPIGTVMSRLARGREQLRRAMDGAPPGLRRIK